MAIEDFKRIVESLRLAVAIADARGGVVFANPALVLLAGRAAAQLAGKPLAELFAAGDQKRVAQGIERVAAGKAGSLRLDVELAGERAGGTWVQLGLQPARDARDRAAGVIAVVQDIGAQRETEQSLNLAGARLLALAESSAGAVMIENAAGEIELANAAFCRMLGIDAAPQSLAGVGAHETLERARGVDRAALERARERSGEPARVPFLGDGGEARALERTPLVVEGMPAGAVWRVRTPAAAAAAPDSPPAAGQIALIERIGEELSVALEGLSGVSIRAERLEFDPAIVGDLRRIRDCTRSALGAIGDLVDFSRVSGGVVLRRSPFRLRPALAELVARVVPDAEEAGCRLRLKVEQDVPDALEGDVERLQLVLRNLLESAFALLPGGETALQVTPEYETDGGIQLAFSVAAAAGAGRPPAGVSAEAGMGVALARFMVAAMGGRLAVGSRAGADALYAFSVAFPIAAREPAPRRPTFVSLVGLAVLIVSAEREQRLDLARMLRAARMLPLEADNAAMAMALLERLDQEGSPVPLVLVSNRLPLQDGFLLAFRIKHHPRFAPTLVMMLASDGRPGDAIACRENGISAYLRYPIRDRQLGEAIVAVTGASVDADETPTLVTRHSLREQRTKSTVLLVDPGRDSQILASHILGRHDCSVVVAHDFAEAAAALEQDFYDLVVADTSLEGLAGEDAARKLRAHIARDPQDARLVAASAEHSPAYQAAKLAIGFNATLAKPFRHDALLALLRPRAPEGGA